MSYQENSYELNVVMIAKKMLIYLEKKAILNKN